MQFETINQAKAYAKSQTADTRRQHKAVKATAWRISRETGESYLIEVYTVVMA